MPNQKILNKNDTLQILSLIKNRETEVSYYFSAEKAKLYKERDEVEWKQTPSPEIKKNLSTKAKKENSPQKCSHHDPIK